MERQGWRAEVLVPCMDVQANVDFLVGELGFLVDLIVPADNPVTAVVSGHGLVLRFRHDPQGGPMPTIQILCDRPHDRVIAPCGMVVEFTDSTPGPVEIPEGKQAFSLVRGGQWGKGRAGMLYRDVLPSRLGGRFIVSHIRVPEGLVPDWVHFHRVRFQAIFCYAGWVRVVYEDQGEPFVMHAGDCVLQPPEIRHRVLEASEGLEVFEIGCPAIHETRADRSLPLPNSRVDPGRVFSGQRFVRHVAKEGQWQPWWRLSGWEARDTGIASATDGLASMVIARSSTKQFPEEVISHEGELLLWFVLRGSLTVAGQNDGTHELGAADCCVMPAGVEYRITVPGDTEILEVCLPARGS